MRCRVQWVDLQCINDDERSIVRISVDDSCHKHDDRKHDHDDLYNHNDDSSSIDDDNSYNHSDCNADDEGEHIKRINFDQLWVCDDINIGEQHDVSVPVWFHWGAL